MASQVEIIYRNILENSTLTVTTENTAFPKYRLHDRDISKLFKGTAFASPFAIKAYQGAVTSYPVDRLIIPLGHNFNGLACSLRYSTDDFSEDDHEAVGWTQGDALLIDKAFTVQTKSYWKLNVTAPATIVELPEMFLGKTYVFAANPLWGAREAWKDNILEMQSQSGYDKIVELGDDRPVRAYELKDILAPQKQELEALRALCGRVKGFYVKDHNGTVMFMKLLNELDCGYDGEDGSDVFYSCRLELRGILGR